MDKIVFMVEKNIHGAWVIYGVLGVRQYYGYTKSEAIKKYREECSGKVFFNENSAEARLAELKGGEE